MLLSHQRYANSLLPAQLKRLQQELHHSLVDFHNGLRATQGALSVNLWSKAGEVIVQVELPGLEADQISVELKDNHVLITTQSPPEDASNEGKWLQRERNLEASRRELELPFSIDAAQSSVSYGRGILELRLVSVQPAESVKMEIQARN